MEKRKYKFKIWKYGIGLLKQENDYDNTDIMNKIDMLEENSTIDEMLSACNSEVNEVSNLLATNQLVAAETVKELERAYREVKSFYDNTD